MKFKKSVLIILCTIFFAFSFCVGVLGYENGIYKRNVSAISDRMVALEVMMDENSRADHSSDKSVAIRINAVIVRYVGKINELRADSRIANEDLVPEIDALYLRGRIAGKCASLYERGRLFVDDDATEELLTLYEESLKSLDGISDVTALYRAESELLAKMREYLYTRRLEMILAEEDSERCYEIVNRGIEEIKWAASAFSSEEEYESIYLKVKKEIEAWRVVEKEEVKLEEFKEALGKISYLPKLDREKLIKEGDDLLQNLSEKLLQADVSEWDKLSVRFEESLEEIVAKGEIFALETAKSQYKELCNKKSNDINTLISSLFYLDKEATADVKKTADESLVSVISAIENAGAASEAESAYCDYIALCVKLIEGIEEKELRAAAGGLSKKVSDAADKTIKEIEALSRIDDGEKLVYADKINTELLAVCARIEGFDAVQSIEKEYEAFADYLSKMRGEAEDVSLSRVSQEALAELKALYQSFDKDEFQKENYAALGEIYERIKADILSSSNTESIEKLIEDAKMEMTGVIIRDSQSDTSNISHTKRDSVIDWLLVVFGSLAVIEVACALCIAYYRQKKKNAPLLLGVLPINKLLNISGIVGPVLGLMTLVLIDATLGVYIFFGLKELLRSRKNTDIYYPSAKTLREQRLISQVNERELCPVYVKSERFIPKRLDSVSAEEADILINDENAELLIIRSDETLPMVRERKKGFVNVDTISENFQAGDTVTLDKLKEKGLIPRNAVCVKVLARGRIDKPLCIKAQGFSANAVKMIALTGGTAVLVERCKKD